MNKTLVKILVWFLILINIIFIGLYLCKFNFGLSNTHSDWGDFGDYSSGTIGVCLSLLTVFFMYLTFKEQRKERFENNFQQYTTNYYSLINLIKENWLHNTPTDYINGREIFGRAFTQIDINNPENTFKKIYGIHENVFHHFCNYLVELFEIIYNNNDLDKEEQENYINRFFSMLSIFELVFFAYFVKYLLDNRNSKEINDFMKSKLSLMNEINDKNPHKDKIVFIISELKK